jgi:hypothetical protein
MGCNSHQECIDNTDPASWCKSDGTCRGCGDWEGCCDLGYAPPPGVPCASDSDCFSALQCRETYCRVDGTCQEVDPSLCTPLNPNPCTTDLDCQRANECDCSYCKASGDCWLPADLSECKPGPYPCQSNADCQNSNLPGLGCLENYCKGSGLCQIVDVAGGATCTPPPVPVRTP